MQDLQTRSAALAREAIDIEAEMDAQARHIANLRANFSRAVTTGNATQILDLLGLACTLCNVHDIALPMNVPTIGPYSSTCMS